METVDPGQSTNPEPSQGTVGRSVTFSDLTTEDQKAFGMAWSLYLDGMIGGRSLFEN
jgi:hypothetical protein